ncbi:MAG TPA: hypothetical protein VLE70_01580 [Anaerolineae bacterium]|nr:hypothetical protein [Anaerolineae bacterium]
MGRSNSHPDRDTLIACTADSWTNKSLSTNVFRNITGPFDRNHAAVLALPVALFDRNI